MPGYPKRGKQRRRRRKKQVSWYNKKYSTKDLALKALSAAKYLKKIINVERKNVDTTITISSLVNVWQVFSLTDVAQGLTEQDRTGLSIKLTSYSIRCFFSNISTTVSKALRVMVVQDLSDANSAAPIAADILDAAHFQLLAHRNIASPVKSYRMLHDQNVVIGPESGSNAQRIINFDDANNQHVKFGGAGATTYQTGAIFIFFWGNDTTVNDLTVKVSSRLRYVDN